jgi:hypothetical protein
MDPMLDDHSPTWCCGTPPTTLRRGAVLASARRCVVQRPSLWSGSAPTLSRSVSVAARTRWIRAPRIPDLGRPLRLSRPTEHAVPREQRLRRLGRGARTVPSSRRPRSRSQGHHRRGRRPCPDPGRSRAVVVAVQPPRRTRPHHGLFADVSHTDTVRWLAARLPQILVRCGATSTCPLRPVRTCADPGHRARAVSPRRTRTRSSIRPATRRSGASRCSGPTATSPTSHLSVNGAAYGPSVESRQPCVGIAPCDSPPVVGDGGRQSWVASARGPRCGRPNRRTDRSKLIAPESLLRGPERQLSVHKARIARASAVEVKPTGDRG